ncbi:hypothetical protein JTM74_32685, partial [Pseudomonas aeruginosa]|nr:hypothetical protein [Pseudomonas aeruginosa]
IHSGDRMSAATPLMVHQAEAEQRLACINLLTTIHKLYLKLAAGTALQPFKTLFIWEVCQ